MKTALMLTGVLFALCTCTQAQSQVVPIDDFESGGLERWWISGSGDYYKGGAAREALAIVADPGSGSKVLHAHVRFGREHDADKCFISRNFKTEHPIFAHERVSFRYKLTTKALSPANALVCRLRTSPASFLDVLVATSDTIRPGEWVQASLPVRPKRIINIYKSLFLPIQQVTFRLDDDDSTNVEFDFYVDDFQLHLRNQVAAACTPKPSPLRRGPKPRVLVVRQSAAGYYNIAKAIGSMAGAPQVHTSLFRGLHLPLSGFPAKRDELFGFDAVVMIDVDPYVIAAEQTQWLTDFVASGGGLFFVAGPNTMGKAASFHSGLPDLLPATMESGEPVRMSHAVRVAAKHPIVQGAPETFGPVHAAYDVKPKPGSVALLAAGDHHARHWGMYSGGTSTNGELFLGPGRDGGHAAGLVTTGFYRDPQTGAPKFVSLALILGDSNGYAGTHAYPCQPDRTYRLSFWLKGDMPPIKAVAITWTTDKAEPAARHYCDSTLGSIAPTPEWQHYEGTFTTGPKSRKMAVSFRMSHGVKGHRLGTRILVDDVVVTDAESGRVVPMKNGDAEEVFAPAILVAGRFGRGRVLLLNTFPTGADRGSRPSFFIDPFFDELVQDSMRWLMPRDSALPFGRVHLSASDIDAGQAATLAATVRAPADRALRVTMSTQDSGQARLIVPAGHSERFVVALSPEASKAAGAYHLRVEAADEEGRLLGSRGATVTSHAAVEAALVCVPWNTVDCRQPLRCRLSARFRAAAKLYAGQARVQCRLIDPAGRAVVAAGPKQVEVKTGVMEPAELVLPPPNLATGAYRLEATLQCTDGPWESRAQSDLFVVDPVARENFYPIMGVTGHYGGEQRLDPPQQRARVDEMWDHGFTAVTADTATIVAHAARKGMALFRDYTRLTLCSRDGRSTPCVFSPDHEAALRKRLEVYVPQGNSIPRGLSMKILDEPMCKPASLAGSEYARAAFQKRFGYPMPDPGKLADLPVGQRVDLGRFMADYVGRAYAETKRITRELGAQFDLIATYCTPAFGGKWLRTLEDAYVWSVHADRIDYDRYIYFYPTSQRVRYVMAHYAYAMMRDISQHLGKPWGHYTEIDDRNYPYQVNPVEASSEHTYVAIAHGADYINTFITRVFATGSGARDARWADFGREACKVRAVGPLLNKVDRPRSELALYFPYADCLTRYHRAHAPYYAHQLLTRAFGEADVAHELTVLDEGLPGRKAVVLCDTNVLPDRAARLLTEFVRAGGLLICDHAPEFNDRGNPCALDPELFAGGEERKLGAATVVREKRYGRGLCLLVQDDLDTLYKNAVETPDPQAEQLLRDFVWETLSRAGLKPTARCDDPDCEAGVRAGEDTWLLTVVNHAEDTRRARVAMPKLPFTPQAAVVLPGHEPVALSDRGRRLDVTLPSRHSRMIALYRRRPARLTVSAADTTAGQPLPYTVNVLDEQGKPCPGHYLVDVAVRDGAGSVRTRFGGRWATAAGRLQRGVVVPVNAAKGAWTIECRLVGWAGAAKAEFTVR